MARGTVRDGFFTSPLGASAISIPEKANTRSKTDSPSGFAPGQPGHAISSGWMKNIPTRDENEDRDQLRDRDRADRARAGFARRGC